MYHQFNIQQFHILPTQCIYVFCVDLTKNSHYFPLTGFYNRDGECLLRGTDCLRLTIQINITSLHGSRNSRWPLTPKARVRSNQSM